MTFPADGANLVLGRGALFFDRLGAAGVRQGERFLGNCTSLEVSGSAETREKRSSTQNNSPLLRSVVISQEFTLQVQCDEYRLDALELFLKGDQALINETGAAVVNEVITAPQQGRYYKVGPVTAHRRNLTAVVVTGPAGAPVFVLGTDYTVDAPSGRIFIVVGGAITPAANLEVDYTYATLANLPSVRMGNAGQIDTFMRYISDNASGPEFELQLWSVTVNPDGGLQFISDDFSSFSLTGRLQALSTVFPNEPFGRLIRLQAGP